MSDLPLFLALSSHPSVVLRRTFGVPTPWEILTFQLSLHPTPKKGLPIRGVVWLLTAKADLSADEPEPASR